MQMSIKRRNMILSLTKKHHLIKLKKKKEFQIIVLVKYKVHLIEQMIQILLENNLGSIVKIFEDEFENEKSTL